jgi:hypothetical protein
VTGSSWADIEAIMNFEVSDTTLRTRRDEWIEAGVSTNSRRAAALIPASCRSPFSSSQL